MVFVVLPHHSYYRHFTSLTIVGMWPSESKNKLLTQKNRLFRRFFCVFSSVFAVWITAIQRWFKGQKSGVSMSEDSRRNRQIPNPSLIGVTAVFSLWIRQILEFSSLIHYNSSTVSLCATKAAVWVYSHAAF